MRMYLVCGEALFDVFDVSSPDSPANSLRFDAVAGGSPFNVAIGLRRLGVDVQYMGGLSRDPLGIRLHQLLENEGVGTQYVKRSNAPTTLAMVALDAHGHPHYDFRGAGCADRTLEPDDLPVLDENVSGIHVGSYSLVVEPIGNTLLTLARREQGRRLITLDPNVRLNVEPDVELWRGRVASFALLADVVKVSDEDLKLLYPGRDLDECASAWLGNHCQLVIVTRGSAGAQVYTRTAQWSIPAYPSSVQDTVGAGDTFQAALIAQLVNAGRTREERLNALTRDTLRQMMDFASAASAITCSRKGPDLPRLADVKAFQERH
jgi:fructokinase